MFTQRQTHTHTHTHTVFPQIEISVSSISWGVLRLKPGPIYIPGARNHNYHYQEQSWHLLYGAGYDTRYLKQKDHTIL